MDEQNHIARGLALLDSGDPRFSLEHPPAANLLSALLPYLTEPIELPFDHWSWDAPDGWYAFAEEMLWNRSNDVDTIVFLARVPIIFLTIALAAVAFRIAKRLWDSMSALTAYSLVLLDPNIIANGRYATTDLAATFAAALVILATIRFLDEKSQRTRAFLFLAVSIGIAYSAKLSLLPFIVLLLPVVLLWLLKKRPIDKVRVLLTLVAAAVAGTVLLWAAYGFDFGPYQFQFARLSGLNAISGPLPTFLAGIERILFLSSGGRPSFLLGEFSTEGFVSYFPTVFLAKTPPLYLGLLILLLYRARNALSTLFRPAVALLVPFLFFFAMAVASSLNIGYRHLLPIIPLLIIFVSGAASSQFGSAQSDSSARPRGPLVVQMASIAVALITAFIIHPNYLSYFNQPSGGPENGHEIVVDSNIDWGQDLIRVQNWWIENDKPAINLSWFGTADPAHYAIDYEPLPGLPRHFNLWWSVPFNPEEPDPGTYLISVSNLQELPLADKNVFPYFRALEPDERIGYSVHVYIVE